MGRHSGRILAVLVVAAGTASVVRAGDLEQLNASLNAMRREVRDLERRVAEMESTDRTEANHAAPNDFRLYWDDGIRMKTNDGKVKIKFGGRLMYDVGWVSGTDMENALGTDLEDAAEVRRARLYAAGNLGKDLGFKLQFDFAGGDADLKDAYLQFKHVPFVGSVKVGHFKEPFSLEELTSSKYITFMERALPNTFAPGRNWGVMAMDAPLDERMTWAVGLFRDVDGYGHGEDDGAYNLTARLTGLPIYADGGRRLVHLGAAYSLRHADDHSFGAFDAHPEQHWAPDFVNSGSFSDADWQHRFGGEAAMVWGPFSAQGEVMAVNVDTDTGDDACLCGFYAYASYFLTGEHRPYKASAGSFGRVKPLRPFREDGGWGAWEIACRYSYVDVTDGVGEQNLGQRQAAATVGLNWYLNNNVRIMWNYLHTCVDGSPSDVDAEADLLGMRVQFDF
ncbi:MAG: OprO/OprP family phosphate-selective porin [Planctomycetota bacterium]